MKVTDLPAYWQEERKDEKREHTHELRLPLEDAARVAALEDIYTDRSQEEILNDMLAAALNDAVNNPRLKDDVEGRGPGRKH